MHGENENKNSALERSRARVLSKVEEVAASMEKNGLTAFTSGRHRK